VPDIGHGADLLANTIREFTGQAITTAST